jgi:hypothetical protein
MIGIGWVNVLNIPSTDDTSSPEILSGNALILVRTSSYELGAPCPKFEEVPANILPFWTMFCFDATSSLFAYIVGKVKVRPYFPDVHTFRFAHCKNSAG